MTGFPEGSNLKYIKLIYNGECLTAGNIFCVSEKSWPNSVSFSYGNLTNEVLLSIHHNLSCNASSISIEPEEIQPRR